MNDVGEFECMLFGDSEEPGEPTDKGEFRDNGASFLHVLLDLEKDRNSRVRQFMCNCFVCVGYF